MSESGEGLYIALYSIHGLIRGNDPELGRDPDTGGQVTYVLELARALSERPEVDRVDLITRQIISSKVDSEYAEPLEQIAKKAWIVRLPFGPNRYLRKEMLWPHLQQLVDRSLQYFRGIGRVPDVVHSHYADAGAVGTQVARILDTLLVHTGHSLGRVKRERLLEKGMDEEAVETRYNMSRRIAAEEQVLERADLVIASTRQEVEDQWGMYETGARSKMYVIPPGVDISRFRAPRAGDHRPAFADEIDRFLREPKRPMILALQRPDERKNLSTLIEAYASLPELQRMANLVLLIGGRDDIRDMPRGQRRVLQEMLFLVDRHDLYGRVAYPKNHNPDDVPEIYRLAVRRRGVFVNPALTEPFGLTLIEAAASGLPVVATNDGGPQVIVDLCRNGVLVDPLDRNGMAEALLESVEDRQLWRRRSRAGVRGANTHFSWSGHVGKYLKALQRQQKRRSRRAAGARRQDRMVLGDRLIICDVDNTLIGDAEALEEFLAELEDNRSQIAFGIATGRVLRSTLKALRDWGVPTPDVAITAVGTEIYYGQAEVVQDRGWRRVVDHRWEPDRVREVLEEVPGLKLQPRRDQRPYKVSYFVDPDRAPEVREIRRRLKDADVEHRAIYSHDAFLDIVPVRASKGLALRYLAHRWGIPMENILVAGDSGNDAEMLELDCLGVVVGNHSREMETLRGRDKVYFAEATHARGILEGARHYEFFKYPALTGEDEEERGEEEERAAAEAPPEPPEAAVGAREGEAS